MIRMLMMIILAAALAAAAPAGAGTALAAGPQPADAGGVLLLYDSLAVDTTRDGNVEALERLLASYAVKVTPLPLDRYRSGTMTAYDSLIVIRNDADLPEPDEGFDADLRQYKGRYLHIGADLPAFAAESLGVRTAMSDREAVSIAVGQLSQDSVGVRSVPYITASSAAGIGRLASGSGTLKGPFGVYAGRFAYAPYFERDNLGETAMSYVLQKWLGRAGQGRFYLLFRNVYPFSDLDRLQELADRLYDAGIPFAVSASPVFGNSDYPAVQRYLETLKYVQSRNGSVLVNAPAVASTISQDVQVLNGRMGGFLDALAAYGVAPLGMGAELYWSYDRHYTNEGMRFFDSVVLFPNERVMYRSPAEASMPFVSAPYSMRLDELLRCKQEGRVLAPFPTDTALTLDMPDGQAAFDETVRLLLDSWISFSDYKAVAHGVRTGAHEIQSRQGMLQIDGRSVGLSDAEKEVSGAHAYVQAGRKSLTGLFTVQNNIFIVLIVLTLILFAFFLIVGYRLYKRKFYTQGRPL